jgi:hypothetical protein
MLDIAREYDGLAVVAAAREEGRVLPAVGDKPPIALSPPPARESIADGGPL